MSASAILIAGLLGYLLGSILFAVVLSRLLHGTDIRSIGSRNPGFTNVFRELGTQTGVLTLLGDLAKGFVAVALAERALAPRLGEPPTVLGLAAAVGALVGHSFPAFFGFRGGKGVATMAGAFLALAPAALGVAVVVWSVVLVTTRYMSVASMSGALTLAACLTWAPFVPMPREVLALAGWGIAAAIVLRHRSNLSKLRRGEERRFSFKRS